MAAVTSPSESSSPGFTPNFSSTYSVVLDHPISEVFKVIGTSDGHERVSRLSGLCSGFELLRVDTVSIPESSSLSEITVRTLPTNPESDVVDPSTTTALTSAPRTRNLPRQFFKLQETVPLLFGLTKTVVHLEGTLTWDVDAQLALYESQSDKGISVWKLRRFEEVEGNKTRVTETIEGICPGWQRIIVQRETTKGHRCA